MRLLSGLESLIKGVSFNNADITKFNKKELSDYRRTIGIIMQNNIFIENETVSYQYIFTSLLEGESKVSKKIEAILGLVNLDKKINS